MKTITWKMEYEELSSPSGKLLNKCRKQIINKMKKSQDLLLSPTEVD